MRIANLTAWMLAGVTSLTGTLAAAEGPAGHPVDGETGFQAAVTEVARDLHWMDNFLLIVCIAITLFVVALLAIVVLRFNRKANPTPATFTHNSAIEVVWTAIPVVILVIIAIPSVRLLFLELNVPEPDLTIKATGNQWYWSYEYPEQQISFDSFMVAPAHASWDAVMADADAKAEVEQYGVTEDTWRLATDTHVVVPVNAVVHVLVTGSDVIHAWTIPSFGSKVDAVPGRMNETWFRAEEPGIYYGQCSELCGKDHAYMPITVEVVTQEAFDSWVKTEQARNDAAATQLAAAE